jgi:hypothetical protein
LEQMEKSLSGRHMYFEVIAIENYCSFGQ